MNERNRAAAHSDIAFMRALAEDGAGGPGAGGAYLVAAGAIFGGASLIVSLANERGLVSGWMVPAVFLAAGLVLWLTLAVIRRRYGGGDGTRSRAMNAAWRGVGFGIWVIASAFILASTRTGDWRIMTGLLPVITALYGAAWLVAAAVSRMAWMNLVAVLAFAASLLLGWLTPEPKLASYVLTASIFGLTLVPGLVLLRQARA